MLISRQCQTEQLQWVIDIGSRLTHESCWLVLRVTLHKHKSPTCHQPMLPTVQHVWKMSLALTHWNQKCFWKKSDFKISKESKDTAHLWSGKSVTNSYKGKINGYYLATLLNACLASQLKWDAWNITSIKMIHHCSVNLVILLCHIIY